MPKIYLEGYSKLKSEIKKTNWPLLPKVILQQIHIHQTTFLRPGQLIKLKNQPN